MLREQYLNSLYHSSLRCTSKDTTFCQRREWEPEKITDVFRNRCRIFLPLEGDVGRDPVGIEVADLEHAIAGAKEARAEIMDEDARDELWLEIMDEHGRLAKVG